MTAPPGDPDTRELAVRTVPGHNQCTVLVTGDVDAYSGPVLAGHLVAAVEQADVATVGLDLREVTFFGAAGLTALVIAHQAATSEGRVLRLRCGTNRTVLRPLDLTGLTTVLLLVEE
jgi:anti-sigma B factor antagonist